MGSNGSSRSCSRWPICRSGWYWMNQRRWQGVSLKAERGTVVAVLGRNGMGKTTLMRSIIGFTPPRRGQLWFKGVDITRLPSYRIAQMGMGIIPQGRRIFPSLSVRENLEIAVRRQHTTGDQHQCWTLERVFGLFPRL